MRKLKHEELTRTIRQKIVRGEYKPGDLLPSQNEMGRQYGMNPLTVREAIASLVQEGLVVRINGKGTFVCEKKRSGPLTIGLATYCLTELCDDGKFARASDFNARLIHGVNVEAQKNGAGVLFALNLPEPEVERKNIRDFIDRQLDAVILQLYFKEQNIDVLRELQKTGVPLVLVDRYAECIETDYVVSDIFEGARQAVNIMLDAGFVNTLYFRIEEDATTLREGEMGYRSAMLSHNLDPRGKTITLPNPQSIGWYEEWRRLAREALATLVPPIGIYVYSSPKFDQLWPFIEELGIPNDQIALTAFDEPMKGIIPEDVLFVNPLQQVEEMGRTAVCIAIEKIGGFEGFRQVRLSPSIRVFNNQKMRIVSSKDAESLVLEH